jgi:peptidoglycan hydrolase-like protein with peptidoglycan-binding domain
MGPLILIAAAAATLVAYKLSQSRADDGAPTGYTPTPASAPKKLVPVVNPLPAHPSIPPIVKVTPQVAQGFQLSPSGINTVADVQNALNALGYASPKLVVDSNPGKATKAAIVKAQKYFGLPQTGSAADGSLKVALQNAIITKANAPVPAALAQSIQTSQVSTMLSDSSMHEAPTLPDIGSEGLRRRLR